MANTAVSMFTLSNDGVYAAIIQATYSVNGSPFKEAPNASSGIVKGSALTVSLSQLGVPEGADVKFQLKVWLTYGPKSTVDASETFTYRSESGFSANYVSGGVIYNATLSAATVVVPTWGNWSANLVHQFQPNADNYYFPSGRAELKAIVAAAAQAGVTLRNSGQRHSQPPLVINDNRSTTDSGTAWLVDMSCYADLGANGTERMLLDSTNNQVKVNTGVTESDLDDFLTQNNKMLQTVTAGGFFSLGGMTAVDVHGASVRVPIFAETAVAFDIMGPDGVVTTIDANSPKVGNYQPLQFARVSLGALGIVTAVTIAVQDRPFATTLAPSKETYTLSTKAAFVPKFLSMLQHDRIETFFNPYSFKFLSLCWNIDGNPSQKTPNVPGTPGNTCEAAHTREFGAPYENAALEPIAEAAAMAAQESQSTLVASLLLDGAYATIESLFNTAVSKYSDLWLTEAARVIFMSYFVELPNIDAAGVERIWDGLNVVVNRINSNNSFMLAGPLEFRFIKGGDAAMAGTYTTNPNSTFLNLDLIAFVKATEASQYPTDLLSFFADIERQWVAMGGFPHNGKMYGFYDPTNSDTTSYTAPFNQNFIDALRVRRGDRLTAFDNYRKQRDPNGLFSNAYIKSLMGS